MITKGIPGQLGNFPMILVKVRAIMSKYHVRRKSAFQLLEKFLDPSVFMGEETVTEILYLYRLSLRISQKNGRTLSRFIFPSFVRTEYHPMHLGTLVFFRQVQQSSPATYFYIVAMGTEAQYPDVPAFSYFYSKHFFPTR
jgi:hypothetical protein